MIFWIMFLIVIIVYVLFDKFLDSRTAKINTKCPKCNHKFVARKDEE